MKNRVILTLVAFILIISCSKDPQFESENEDTALKASFKYEQTKNAPCWVYFTNTSKNYKSAIWDIGYGFNSPDLLNLKKWYDASGSYPISIRVYGSKNDSLTYTENITVK